MSDPTPTINRAVNYCAPSPEGTDEWIIRAATISDVDPDGSGSVGLTICTCDPDKPVEYIPHVPHGDGTFVVGTWNWPVIS